MRLKLDQVLPGMTLADDARDAHGNLLLPRGRELAARDIAALRQRGVAVVAIAGEAEAPPDDAVAAARTHEQLDRLFRHAGDDPTLGALRAQVERYRKETHSWRS
jgi:hypothetical protein